MISRLRFPIRLKILITFLFVITVVVSLIISAMARLLSTDKTTYIRDLTSVIALHVAEEANSLLVSYHGRLRVFAELMLDQRLASDGKARMIRNLFGNFPNFVAVSVHEEGREPVTVYDAKTLEAAGITKEDLFRYQKEHPLSAERIQSIPIYVENATITPELPLLLITTTLASANSKKPTVITATVLLDPLLRLARKPSAFEVFIMDSQGILIAHADLQKVVHRARADWIPQLTRLVKQKGLLGTTVEYEYGGEQMIGGFAGMESSSLLVGVQIPKAAAYLTARELLNDLIILSLTLFLATALISVFLAYRLTRPLELLSEAAREVGQGKFDISIKITSNDEIGLLSGSFNEMTSELRDREEALDKTQAALVQSEKMSAFGQLSAGIAHEVKNPLTGILGHTQLSLHKLEEQHPARKNIVIVEKETKRCTTIINNLMKFARREEIQRRPLEINHIVKEALAIVEHQMTISHVKLQLDLADNLPPTPGNDNQLQQVLMNFAINAQQAMNGKPGLLRVETRRSDSGHNEIVVSDTGPGIPEEIRDKIFEPFFTTKPVGQGTGLGLSVTYGIIKDHNGEITLESELGKGSTFIITLPTVAESGAATSSEEQQKQTGQGSMRGPS